MPTRIVHEQTVITAAIKDTNGMLMGSSWRDFLPQMSKGTPPPPKKDPAPVHDQLYKPFALVAGELLGKVYG